MTALANAHQEVVRFDIAMDKVSRVDVLDTRNLTMVEWVNIIKDQAKIYIPIDLQGVRPSSG